MQLRKPLLVRGLGLTGALAMLAGTYGLIPPIGRALHHYHPLFRLYARGHQQPFSCCSCRQISRSQPDTPAIAALPSWRVCQRDFVASNYVQRLHAS